jgi:hypothetical protein
MALDPALRQNAARRRSKQLVTLPVIGHLRNIDHQKEVDELMAQAAKLIGEAKLLYRWRRSSGLVTLCVWDSVIQVFTMLDNELFAEFVGKYFDLTDGTLHFGLPHQSTADRLYEECLKDASGLEFADWALTDKRRGTAA